MNIQTLDRAFSRDYSDYCPSWIEYECSGPVEQRAITIRWVEIITLMGRATDAQYRDIAIKNYSRAVAGRYQTPKPRDETQYQSSHETGYGEAYSGITNEDEGL